MKNFLRSVCMVYQYFVKDGCFYRASSLAYATLLTIVPMMAALLLVLSIFPSIQYMGKQIESFIFSNLVASSSTSVESYISGFSSQAQQLSWIGTLALFVMTAVLMFSIENAFNTIWKLDSHTSKLAIMRAIVRHWLLLFLIPILIAASLLISSYVSSLNWLAPRGGDFDYPSLIIKTLPSIFLFLVFTLMYKFIPATKVKLGHAATAAIVATLLFALLKNLFTLYIKLFPTYKILYGAFAAVPLFLIWVYVAWLVILFCGEICWFLGSKKPS